MTTPLNRLTGETQSKMLDLFRRAPRTINELAAALGLTDNAVRTHVAALARDGLIEQVGTERETGGKPARRYGLTQGGGELFPKAYALALEGLVEEIAKADGWPKAEALLQAVGARVAAGAAAKGELPARVAAAADALRRLGADLDLQQLPNGWRLQGYACPLSAVTAVHPQACGLVTAIVAEITGRPVTEKCAHGPAPRCCFEVAAG